MSRRIPAIPGIILHDIVGTPRIASGVIIVPARFEFLEGEAGPLEGCLELTQETKEFLTQTPSLFDSDYTLKAWLWGRLSAVFGYCNPREKWCHEIETATFLAVLRGADSEFLKVLALECSSIWRSGLIFSKATDEAAKQTVGSAFWKLILSEPAVMSPFEVTLYDDYDGAFFKWICRGNQLHLCDLYGDLTNAGEEIPEKYDPHQAYAFGEMWECPECGGTGEESFLPAGEPCEACLGTGRTTVAGDDHRRRNSFP